MEHKKYEYLVLMNWMLPNQQDLITDFLNEQGKEGWELVTREYIGKVYGTNYIFKRAIINQPS